MERPGSSIGELVDKLKEADNSGIFKHMLETELMTESIDGCKDSTYPGTSGSGSSSRNLDPSVYDTVSSDEGDDSDLGDKIERDGEQLDALIEHARNKLNASSASSYRELPSPKRDVAIITVPLPGVPEDIIRRVQEAYDFAIRSVCHDMATYRISFGSPSPKNESKGVETEEGIVEEPRDPRKRRCVSGSSDGKESDKDQLSIIAKFTEGFKLKGRSNPDKEFTMKIGVNGITYEDVRSAMEHLGEC